IEFLEKNVQILLNEMNIKLERNSYLKLMYYIYRDFIGLNRIEPLMNDGYIEDIECNGKSSSLYIVHRRYGNIKTNIIFDDFDELSDFVEKLAQRWF
ncbi:secretion system protein E, partial [Candidatus Woesearchaeota archaeon]|nr:secretion system protein E [Candidatus Woesearchaeota archaeon]